MYHVLRHMFDSKLKLENFMLWTASDEPLKRLRSRLSNRELLTQNVTLMGLWLFGAVSICFKSEEWKKCKNFILNNEQCCFQMVIIIHVECGPNEIFILLPGMFIEFMGVVIISIILSRNISLKRNNFASIWYYIFSFHVQLKRYSKQSS